MNTRPKSSLHKLKLVKLGIDTQQEFILYIHAECFIGNSEGYKSQTQIIVELNGRSIIATLNLVHSNILRECEASLSESAWQKLEARENDYVSLSHLPPVSSLQYVRSKIYGNELTSHKFDHIIRDVVAGKYSNIHLASFLTACGHDNLSTEEIIFLTEAMVKTGGHLDWKSPIIVDKHSVGGIPGNRTTPIVVAIVAAAGLIIPKTSSRAITSPAGTADTIETMTQVCLSEQQIKKVIESEGGCMVWGGALGLSPADDILIRVERALDIDPIGQMIASVLSKKSAIGATHVLIDIPVGPTAKIRSDIEFFKFKNYFSIVGLALGLQVYTVKTNGTQPIGCGIGPILEAKDILSVLRNNKNSPIDLKRKAISLAGAILEFGSKAPSGEGRKLATSLLENGSALKKFIDICEAQGGFREPVSSSITKDVVASQNGFVTEIDNRSLAKIAKLAGAPYSQSAGIEFFSKIGTYIERGDVLFRIHSESTGALDYAFAYAKSLPNIVKIKSDKI
ncbi:MAG: thymidine phosphorylase family protein [Legionellaceae bacterium]|nr:thymidine phosphorylase family protein [Legionellaceae bacterium]